MAVAPRDSGITRDRFNDGMRESPAWRDFMTRAGQPLDGRPIKLSERQRKALQGELARAGFVLPKGLEIDPAGNVNEADNGFFEKTSVRIALAAGAAALTAGAAGWGPLAGVFGSSAPTAASGVSTAAAATQGGTSAMGGWSSALPWIFRGIEAGGAYLGAREDRNAAIDEMERRETLERERLDEQRRQFDTSHGEGTRRYDQDFAEAKRRYDADIAREGERFTAREGRLEPFRAMSGPGIAALQNRLGLGNSGVDVPPGMFVRASGFGQAPGGQSRPAAPPPTAPPTAAPGPAEDPSSVPASAFGQPPPMAGPTHEEQLEEWIRNGRQGPIPGGAMPPWMAERYAQG